MQRSKPVRLTPYRILALDGGGIRGLITAAILERLTHMVPGWLQQCDLFAGTSTGGIIAAGLAYGLQPADLRRLYYHKGKIIFADSLLDNVRDVGRLFGAQYDVKNLRNELSKIVGAVTLGELNKRVLIPTFDLDNQHPFPAERTWKPKFFHNYPGPDNDNDARLVDVVTYTSAAPTYFPATDGYVDGGVIANNPSMAAIAQTQDSRAQIELRPELTDLVLLSLGTGKTTHFVEGSRLDWGFVQWARPLTSIVTDGVTDVADYQSRQLLQERYHRLQPRFASGVTFPLDDWQQRDAMLKFVDALDLEETVAWLEQTWL